MGGWMWAGGAEAPHPPVRPEATELQMMADSLT